MARKKGAGGSPASQAEKDVAAAVRNARAKARDLLKKAGRDVKSVRTDVSKLKKAGLVSKRLDVRSYLPSRYMLKKIEQNRDVLEGRAVAVKAPKKVRQQYTSKGVFEQRGSTLIVPKEYSNQRTRISRGLVEVSRPLRMGEEIRLILPFKTTDLEGVATKLRDDPTLDGMKKPDELFGFRLFGHTMNTIGFPNADELADYILTRYNHLFSGKQGREGVKHFELFRFKSGNSQMQPGPEDERVYTPRKKRTPGGVGRDHIIRQRMQRDASRKAKKREKETPAEREKRLQYQRTYAARKRQSDFLGD